VADVAADVSEQTIHDVIIVGSGPAGYTAATYSARAQLDVVVFEGSQFGGALMTTTEVENYPGFAEGIQGPELMDQMRRQAERFGAQLRPEDVDSLDLTGDVKSVTVGGETHRARSVILAMGAAPRYLDVPGEERLLGHGVSACATCDGFFFRDHDIVVVGGGDSAMEEATFLTRFARSVTIVHRRDEFRASGIMLERARNDEKITFRTNAVVTEVLGENAVTGVRVRDVVTGEEDTLDVTGMFVAIGHDPRSTLVAGQVDLDDEGYVLVDTPSTYTNLPGVFACGDLIDHTYQQAITAAGSGCTASIDAERWLAEVLAQDPAAATPETSPKPTVDSEVTPELDPVAG
jgi:thioredoxin reductase (NADPH)